jgi:hypothetical protein
MMQACASVDLHGRAQSISFFPSAPRIVYPCTRCSCPRNQKPYLLMQRGVSAQSRAMVIREPLSRKRKRNSLGHRRPVVAVGSARQPVTPGRVAPKMVGLGGADLSMLVASSLLIFRTLAAWRGIAHPLARVFRWALACARDVAFICFCLSV